MKHVIVSYPRQRTEQKITIAERDVVVALGVAGNPVAAIKFIRVQYGIGLYEAKQIVDTIREPSATYVYEVD